MMAFLLAAYDLHDFLLVLYLIVYCLVKWHNTLVSLGLLSFH